MTHYAGGVSGGSEFMPPGGRAHARDGWQDPIVNARAHPESPYYNPQHGWVVQSDDGLHYATGPDGQPQPLPSWVQDGPIASRGQNQTPLTVHYPQTHVSPPRRLPWGTALKRFAGEIDALDPQARRQLSGVAFLGIQKVFARHPRAMGAALAAGEVLFGGPLEPTPFSEIALGALCVVMAKNARKYRDPTFTMANQTPQDRR